MMDRIKSKKQAKALYVLVALLLTAAVLLGAVNAFGVREEPRQAVTEGVMLDLNEGWQQEGECKTAYAIPAGGGEGLMLSVRTVKQDFTLSLRDAAGQESVFYTYEAGNGPVEMRLFIALPDGAAGKTLVLETASATALNYMMHNEAVLGTQAKLTLHYLWRNLYALAFCLFCLLCAAELCVLLVSMRRVFRPEFHHQTRVMAGLMVDAGIWVLTDSELLALAVDQASFVSFVSLVSFCLIAPLTLEFVRCTLREACCGLKVLQAVQVTLLLADILGWVLAGQSMFWLLIPTHLSIVASIVVALYTLYTAYQKGEGDEVRSILMAFAALAVCAAASLLAFYRLHGGRQYAVFYCVGLLAFLLLLSRTVIRRVKQAMDEQMQLEDYKKLAYVDSLTGLANYTAFNYAKSRWPERTDWVYIVMVVNWLKQTNDRYGHQAGDELLSCAARCIREAFYRAENCFRIGGDEFAAIGTTLDEAAVQKAAEELRRLCAEWNDRVDYPVSMAVGYAMQAGRTMTAEELFAEADAAMYRDKADIKKARGGTIR